MFATDWENGGRISLVNLTANTSTLQNILPIPYSTPFGKIH